MRFRIFTVALLSFGLGLNVAPARGQQIDTINIATAGIAIFNYLPITLAERIGAYKKQDLKVTINDFQGGQRSVEALVGGSVDLSINTYDNTVLLQSKGVSLVATALINRSIGAVIAIADKHAAKVKSPADVKGFMFGVSSPGSATHRILNLYLAKGGLTSNDISVHGLGGGAGAVAIIRSGRIDGFVHSDPVVSQGLKDGKMKIVVDGRTKEGMDYLYGGYVAATAVISTPDFIRRRPQTMQKFVNAMVQTLKWMQTTPLDEIMAMIPPEFYGPDKDMYRQSLAAQIPIFSADGGLRLDELNRTYQSMVHEGVLKADQKISIDQTYNNAFVDTANGRR